VHLTEVTGVKYLNTDPDCQKYDIDLYNYVEERQPQTTEPRRHLIEHTFEIAEETFGKGVLKRGFVPIIRLTSGEISWARTEAQRLANGKPLVWLQTKSRMPEKDIPEVIWQELVHTGSCAYTFVDLSRKQYSRRQAIALTAVADAGITLDSFLLHASEAVRAKNVLVVLVSTYPEVVCYPDQTAISISKESASSAHSILAILDTTQVIR
jgi:ADP-heptose:LPS heptosyltransferase